MTGFSMLLVVIAGVFGVAIGSFLNVVVYRVPAGISLLRESRCPHCDSAISAWQNVPVVSWLVLRGRCAGCGAVIPGRYPAVELFTGIAFALVTWALLAVAGPSAAPASVTAAVLAFLYFAAISIALTLIDLDTRRLPNAIVLPSYLVGGVLLTLASALVGDWAAILRTVGGMAILYAFYFLLRFVRPDGMGGGDVKLAGVIGIYLGWVGWGPLVVGAFAAFVLGGIFGLALIVLQRAGRRSAIPFGPWMIAGAWIGIFTGEAIAAWYVGLIVGS